MTHFRINRRISTVFFLNRLSMLIAAADSAANTSIRMVPESTPKKALNSTRKHVSFNEQPQVRHLPRPLMEQIPTLRGHTYAPSVSLPLGHVDSGKRTVPPASCQAQHAPSGFPPQQTQRPHDHRIPKTGTFSSPRFTVPSVPRSH